MKKNLNYSLSMFCLSLFLCISSCNKNDDGIEPSPTVFGTVSRTIVADEVPGSTLIKPWDIGQFASNGYGKWHYGPGMPYVKKLDLMPNESIGASSVKGASLLKFFAFTDIHITDKESPAQSIYYSFIDWMFNSTLSCYSPAMLYSTHTLNAAVQTVNDLHSQSKLDFGLVLGDMMNSSMYNEIRWFIDVMDGKTINPDSGKDDDPVPGPDNDYQDEFQAVGLDQTIPWYATVGNHDHFFMGAAPFNNRIKSNLTGDAILRLDNIFVYKVAALNMETFYMGTLDGSTKYGDILGAGIAEDITPPEAIPADPNRRIITKKEMINEFFSTTSSPVGHGFNYPTLIDGCYSFEPKADLPLKVIVMDDTQDESDVPLTGLYGAGSLANGRLEWLIEQLDAGQSEGKLMIIAAHVPIGVEPDGSMIGWYPDQVKEKSIIEKLKEYPNLILWASGHRHKSAVTGFVSNDSTHPENGFWEVETKSLKEFPQQFRTFEIVSNTDHTLSIFVTNVDVEVKTNSLAAEARTYAIAATELFGIMEKVADDDMIGKNYELIVPLSPEMQTKIENYKSQN